MYGCEDFFFGLCYLPLCLCLELDVAFNKQLELFLAFFEDGGGKCLLSFKELLVFVVEFVLYAFDLGILFPFYLLKTCCSLLIFFHACQYFLIAEIAEAALCGGHHRQAHEC